MGTAEAATQASMTVYVAGEWVAEDAGRDCSAEADDQTKGWGRTWPRNVQLDCVMLADLACLFYKCPIILFFICVFIYLRRLYIW